MKVVRKPEYISWDDIADCQKAAHKNNISNNIKMLCANMDGEELCSAVGDGICLVAIDDENNVMGTLSIIIRDVRRWWHKGAAAYISYVAVNPLYQGQGIYKEMSNKAIEIIKEMRGVDVAYLNTHINNHPALITYINDGYKKVRFSPSGGHADYYSVEMAKWINGNGYNRLLCDIMYFSSEIVVRILFKPGKIRRF